MDSDVVIGLLMILVWIFSSLVARFGRKARQVPEEEGGAPRPASRGDLLQKALRELADQMGIEVETAPSEAPVASEHTGTVSEHRRTATETRGTWSEHVAAPAEHRHTASEIRRTASEAVVQAAEHDLTASEHRRGDVEVSRLPAKASDRRRPRSEFARRLQADLTGGSKDALARAIVLREILGPPVSLRSPEQDRA